jgi:hypothetical protein
MFHVNNSAVKGKLEKNDFPTLFTTFSHAGIVGAVLIATTTVQIYFLSFTFAIFLCLSVLGTQISNNVAQEKTTFGAHRKADFDWLYYCRWYTSAFTVLFVMNSNVLVFATGAIHSPFIPFYIMVFTVALNNCGYNQPALSVTLFFILCFIGSILTPFVAPSLAAFSGAPLTQYKEWFDGGFAVASMIVPFVSGLIESNRKGSSATAGALISPATPPPQNAAQS